MSILKSYWEQSKSPLYSIVITLPLLLIYEFLIFSFNHSDILGLRNGADIIFHQIFALFNIYGFYAVGFVILSAFLLVYYFTYRSRRHFALRGQFFVLMLLESIVYAILFHLVVQQAGRFGLIIGPSNLKFQIVLALGAGVYEEFIFRVILVTGMTFFLANILRFNNIVATSLAIVIAALLFALFHYLGPYGETFTLRSGAVRLAAGIFLGLLYALRGYGITAYTHTFYDLIIILY